MGGTSVPPIFSLERIMSMKDLRDPKKLGETLLRERARFPKMGACEVYDEIVVNMNVPNFKEESHYAVQHRHYADSPPFSFTAV
jgi:hypothetical protein